MPGMKLMTHLVCDRCGHLWRASRAVAKCPACGHTSLWEFEREQPAREHAAHIRDPHTSVRPLS